MARPKKAVETTTEDAKDKADAQRVAGIEAREEAPDTEKALVHADEEPKEAPAEEAPAEEAPEVEEEHDDELSSELQDLRDETADRIDKPFDSSNLFKARATFDTSGVAGTADHDFRRAYATYDQEALENNDVPGHLEKYVTSDAGLPAILRREEEARADMPSGKERKQKKA
jgi:hypothetical protein